MNIGIDIDGVICNLNSYVRKYFKKYLKKNNIPFKLKKYKECFNQQYNVPLETENDFWKQYIFHYAKKSVMMNHSSFYINKLHKDGHKIIIITSRLYSSYNNDLSKQMREKIKKWLDKNKIYYDDISFSNETVGKKDYIIKHKIDVMIDDSLRNINELCKIVPVIIFKNPSNKNAKSKNKIMANGWKDIYKIISKLNKSKNL